MISTILTITFTVAAALAGVVLVDSAIKARDAMRRIFRELNNGD